MCVLHVRVCISMPVRAWRGDLLILFSVCLYMYTYPITHTHTHTHTQICGGGGVMDGMKFLFSLSLYVYSLSIHTGK